MATPRTRTRAPTSADIAAAIAAASAAVPTEPSDSVTKLIVGAVVTFVGLVMMAVFLWVGTSVNDLSKSVTLMSANLDNVQKSITDLQQNQGATSKTTSDLAAQVAAGGARSTAIEQDVGRIKERVRMLEGQPPVRQ